MKKLIQFSAFGLAVVPWSVPDIGTTTTRTGKRVRFARRAKKSQLALGRASLEDWQRFVADAARKAMATAGPGLQTGPLKLHMDFYARTPPGRRDGALWAADVSWNPETGKWAKKSRGGKPDADLVNMFKGTEDALQDVLYANDVQTRIISAAAWYGPQDGVIVTVYAIEPGDFPGRGDPVA